MKNMNESALKGLLITVSDDMGPRSVVNLSKLDDGLAFKVALFGMTILMLGNSNPNGFAGKCNKILGPLPVPLDPEADLQPDEIEDLSKSDALAIIFNVKADLPTEDPRAIKNGRDAVLWFIFNTTDRENIFTFSKNIENIANHFISNIKFESQLDDKEYFSQVLDEIHLRISQTNVSSIVENYIPESIDYAEYAIYKYSPDKEIIFPIEKLDEIKNLPIFILVDIFEKQINIIQTQPVSKKDLFVVSKSVSNLNLSLKREFKVRIITDEFEILMYLERMGINS